ncbi:FAD-dependent oxidoreductase [Geodermatophilus sp. YIM 151500]|uniref:oxidoreductase n=1 Tax=Geodermatophilus sp. YIM 151500 TaxID=2984531 RepID=UPI0021E49DA1|nr:FAD-dependent oxidoreductase [Geodermatophilus sp. YIM 151500]MCV2489209.1 FAD-dependent oxidoreductase [Geodermatophilus sp. YIM 151500]
MPVAPFAVPLPMGRLTLHNRFVSAPMERNYCEIDGTMTDRYVDYLARRAQGGAALVFTEASYVRADGKGRIRQMGVHVDERVPGIARAAAAVHAAGALFGVELNHGGRTSQGAVSGFTPVAPSPVPCEVVGGERPAQLDAEEIEHLIACYGEAAARCQAAGVDVISLHGGHGYLIHQFLSPAYNRRDDEWGDPTLFVNRVIESVRSSAPGIVLGLRFSAFEGVEGGLTPELTRRRMAAVDTDRLDFLDVSAGNYEAGQWIIQPGEWERGLLREHAAPYVRGYAIPVGVAGRISTPETAAEIIAAGQADFVSLARTLHADPDFCNRALDGGRYRPCIACNHCIDSLAAGPVPCTVNPWVGREADQPGKPAAQVARVAVVGAGPAGMGVARELAIAGHAVDLYDERPETGGDFALAARLHAYPEYARIVEWYRAELADLGVAVHTRVRVGPGTFAGRVPDAVVLATGGAGSAPDLPGAGTRPTRDVRDFLLAGDPAPEAVTVYGGDREAAAVADDLLRRGSRVVLVCPQPQLAPDVGRRAGILLLPRLAAAARLTTHLGATVVRVEAARLLLRNGTGEHWVDAPGELLVSHGVSPRSALLDRLRALAPRLGVHPVGDASGDGGSVHAALTGAVAVAAEITRRAELPVGASR